MDWRELLFSFKGRINRGTLWRFLLFYSGSTLAAFVLIVPVVAATSLIGTKLNGTLSIAGIIFFAGALFLLVFAMIIASAVPLLAFATKRLHDRDKGATWLILFVLVPMVLQAIEYFLPPAISASLYWTAFGISAWGFVEIYCLPGTIGENRYGPDPLGPTISK